LNAFELELELELAFDRQTPSVTVEKRQIFLFRFFCARIAPHAVRIVRLLSVKDGSEAVREDVSQEAIEEGGGG
jgi:hypothetical protein